jgi:putative membrane protein
MEILSKILVGLVAIEHLYIMYFEMFAWETIGKKTFKSLPENLFKPTKGLAANQGLYNGFLSAGLIWTFFISDNIWQTNISIFFLTCVVVAGVYGALTASKKIFITQALPNIGLAKAGQTEVIEHLYFY